MTSPIENRKKEKNKVSDHECTEILGTQTEAYKIKQFFKTNTFIKASLKQKLKFGK